MYFNYEGFPAVVFLFLVLGIPIFIVALMAASSSRFKRRKNQLSQQSIKAEYDPPENLSPAEIGYLFDSRFGRAELVSTLLDLEQKGLIELTFRKVDGVRVAKKGTLNAQFDRAVKFITVLFINDMGIQECRKKIIGGAGLYKAQQ
jgi:hypothetical protein